MKYVSLILTSFLFMSSGQNKVNSNYITLQYTGDNAIDKPMPVFIFTLDSFRRSEEILVQVVTSVNRCQFLGIKDAIENHNGVLRIDSSQYGLFNCVVVRENKFLKYKFDEEAKIVVLLDEILTQLKNNKKYAELYEEFKEYISRIRFHPSKN